MQFCATYDIALRIRLVYYGNNSIKLRLIIFVLYTYGFLDAKLAKIEFTRKDKEKGR